LERIFFLQHIERFVTIDLNNGRRSVRTTHDAWRSARHARDVRAT